MQKLNHEMLVKDEKITELQKNIQVRNDQHRTCSTQSCCTPLKPVCLQECEARCVCVNKEVKRLRACVADAAVDVDRAQKDLHRLTQQLQDEKTQHKHTQTHMNTLQQHHQRDSQVHTHTQIQCFVFDIFD